MFFLKSDLAYFTSYDDSQFSLLEIFALPSAHRPPGSPLPASASPECASRTRTFYVPMHRAARAPQLHLAPRPGAQRAARAATGRDAESSPDHAGPSVGRRRLTPSAARGKNPIGMRPGKTFPRPPAGVREAHLAGTLRGEWARAVAAAPELRRRRAEEGSGAQGDGSGPAANPCAAARGRG